MIYSSKRFHPHKNYPGSNARAVALQLFQVLELTKLFDPTTYLIQSTPCFTEIGAFGRVA